MDKYNNTRNSYNDYEDGYPQSSYGSRARKNEELYQEMSHDELKEINLASNAHVIGENNKNIDVEKIKELLEKKYHEEPRKSRALIKQEEEEVEEKEEEETKEYNINAIIEKAKQDKEIDYERERLKKVRDTQYDILKGLSLNDEEEEEETSKVTSNKDDLVNLINTITEKELTREMDPLDILTDLKGSDNTVVLDGIKEEIEEKERENDTTSDFTKEKRKEDEKRDIDKTFYTNSVSFSKSDFDDFNDLKEDMETNKVLVRVLLIIITVVIVAGILFVANQVFHLNWF